MISDPDPDSRAYAPRTAALPDIPAAIGRGMVRYAQVEESILHHKPVTAPLEGVIARGRGLAALGKGLQDLGESGLKLYQEVQRAKATLAENESDLEQTRLENAARAEMAKEPDPEKRPAIARAYVAKHDEFMAGKSVPRNVRDLLRLKNAGWAERFIGGVEVDAGIAILAKEKDTMIARRSARSLVGDRAGAHEVNNQITARGHQNQGRHELAAAQIEDDHKKWLQEQENELQKAEMEEVLRVGNQNPDAAAEMVNAADYGKHLLPSTVTRIRNAVQGLQRDSFATAQEDVLDAITTGKDKTGATVTTEADVARVAGKRLRAHEVKKLQDFLTDSQSHATKAKIAQPAYQRALFGELLDRVWKFDREKLGGITGEKARDEYSAILMQARNLDPVLRAEVTKPLADKWYAAGPKVSGTIREYINQSIQDLFNAQKFGPTKKTVPREPGDPGYVAWQAGSKEVDDYDQLPNARQAMADAKIAIDKWIAEQEAAGKPVTREQATLEIIKAGGGKLSDMESSAIIQKAGEKTMPPPAPVMNLNGIRQRLQPAGAQGDAGAPGTPESIKDGRITSFGYPGDPHRDDNSRAGIGAWVPDTEAAKIHRGEASDFKMRAGDIAVSPDVERSFLQNGIRPGDSVTLTYQDGSTHTGRWMDRTANDAQAKARRLPPLRGRFDIYSPGGKQPNDGQPVVTYALAGKGLPDGGPSSPLFPGTDSVEPPLPQDTEPVTTAASPSEKESAPGSTTYKQLTKRDIDQFRASGTAELKVYNTKTGTAEPVPVGQVKPGDLLLTEIP